MVYDVCIIGAGPAGMTAALYAVRSGLTCVMVEKLGYGGQMTNTYDLQNYPGFPQDISGFDLAQNMGKQAEKYGAKLLIDEVSSVDLASVPKKITGANSTIQARSVIIASGAQSRKLGVPGEKEYAGHGVSYCATCDGNFFREKDVCVVGGGNTAAIDAQYLARICRKVYIIHRRDQMRAAHIDIERLKKLDNVEFIFNANVSDIVGSNNKVEHVDIKYTDGDTKQIPVSAVFVAIGQDPSTQFLRNVLECDKNGAIITDEDMQTSLQGVFAAGDVRHKTLRQIVTATSDGAIAAESAFRWLSHH